MKPDRSNRVAPSSCEGCGASLHYPRDPYRVFCDSCMVTAGNRRVSAWGSSGWVVQNAVEADGWAEPSPGWYADPTYGGRVRRWDGNVWTNERRSKSIRRSPSTLQKWEDQLRGKIEVNGYVRTVGAGVWWLFKGIAFVVYFVVLLVLSYWFIST